MNQTEFTATCQRIFEINALTCTREQAERLYELTVCLLTENKKMNLTAITEEKAIILRHYVDSVTISRHIPTNAKVIDIGCGAGFPALPLAVFRPDLQIVALDGTEKRIRYVQATADELGLSNVTAIAGRAEEYAQKSEHRERYDVVTARAVAALPILCELCLPFVQIGGKMIAMKSQQAAEELQAAKQGIKICGGEKERILPCHLLSDEGESEQRNLIVIEKTAGTPNKYPRQYAKIAKKPL